MLVIMIFVLSQHSRLAGPPVWAGGGVASRDDETEVQQAPLL